MNEIFKLPPLALAGALCRMTIFAEEILPSREQRFLRFVANAAVQQSVLTEILRWTGKHYKYSRRKH